jgi:hypothetical protein
VPSSARELGLPGSSEVCLDYAAAVRDAAEYAE